MTAPRCLIAGIGNIFLGDDAFGVEVVRQLAARPLPPGVDAKDFGIRGFDLACALQAGYDAVILVDALPRGSLPGTLHVLEPAADHTKVDAADLEMHHLDPVRVLRLVQRMGRPLPCLRVVGCEPATLEPSDEEMMTLSDPVRRAVPRAVEVVAALAAELLAQAVDRRQPAGCNRRRFDE